MSPSEILGLGAVAAAAGIINAVAGGGTLLTFPTLLFYGTPAIVANATSTLALVIGTAGSIFGFRRQIGAVWPWLGRFALVSTVGGWLGSVLLTRTSDRVFSQLVPFLILFATVLFFAQGAFRRFAGFSRDGSELAVHSRHVWLAILFQFGVSVYGGYFGAAIGILMLASLGLSRTARHSRNERVEKRPRFRDQRCGCRVVRHERLDRLAKGGSDDRRRSGRLLHRRALFATDRAYEGASLHYGNQFHDIRRNVLPAVSVNGLSPESWSLGESAASPHRTTIQPYS